MMTIEEKMVREIMKRKTRIQYGIILISVMIFSLILLCTGKMANNIDNKNMNDYPHAICVAVTDGDTVTLNINDFYFKVRLAYIDAPEKSQPEGLMSKKFLIDLILNKTVIIKHPKHKIDQYNRSIVELYLDQDTCINYLIVEKGMAFVYKDYIDPKYITACETARNNKIGIWINTSIEPPWDYRKENKKNICDPKK